MCLDTMNNPPIIRERQPIGTQYLSLNENFDVLVYTEENSIFDNERWVNGNYFSRHSGYDALNEYVDNLKYIRSKFREQIYNSDFPVSDDLIIHIPRL